MSANDPSGPPLPPFSVTWDYRCPFARNVHEHLVTALEAGAPWEVGFIPFSLSQVHVEEDDLSVWEDGSKGNELLAIAAALVIREQHPDRFLAVHRALFAARHDDGRDIRERSVIAETLASAGVEPGPVVAQAQLPETLDGFRRAHEAAAADHGVFGVPTFVVGHRAVFVRIMSRPRGDGALATRTIEQVVRLVDAQPELNEFKHTRIER